MTLLELLRQELPKRGGWPEGAVCVVQDNDGQVCFSSRFEGLTLTRDKTDWLNGEWGGNWSNEFYDVIADDRATAIVTREQYEATGWDGTDLPPIGVAVDYVPGLLAKSSCDDNKPEERTTVHVVSHAQYPNNGDKVVIATWLTEKGCMRASVFSPRCLRPLRTEAERAIDEMVQLSGVSTGAAKILYDAGYRK